MPLLSPARGEGTAHKFRLDAPKAHVFSVYLDNGHKIGEAIAQCVIRVNVDLGITGAGLLTLCSDKFTCLSTQVTTLSRVKDHSCIHNTTVGPKSYSLATGVGHQKLTLKRALGFHAGPEVPVVWSDDATATSRAAACGRIL